MTDEQIKDRLRAILNPYIGERNNKETYEKIAKEVTEFCDELREQKLDNWTIETSLEGEDESTYRITIKYKDQVI